MITLKLVNHEHGKGFWKFNASLLRDEVFVTKVKQTILQVVKQYMVSGQDIEVIAMSDVEFTIDDQLLWEMMKMEIRKKAMCYGSLKKREKQKEEKELVEQINILEDTLSHTPTAQVKEQLNEKKIVLENIREASIRATMIRSRARWVEMGEKPTHYFCNLEKRNYTNKAITVLQVGNKTITELPEILKEQANFYKDLYTSKYDNVGQVLETETFLIDDNIVQLSNEQKETCEGPITEGEIKLALRNMPNNKSPGMDGYPAEFFKFFWNDIGIFVLRSFNYALHTGSLSITQKRGIITCIPKGEKPRQFMKNWRPITLLCVDYKLLSACLANRFKRILPDIISDTQKGF